MGVYDSLVATADRLIKAKGAATTLARESSASFDAATDTDVKSNPDYDIYAVGIAPGRSAEYRIGSLQGRNLMEFYISSKSVTPTKGDTIAWLGKTYKLVWVNVLNPNADATIFTQAYGET